SRAFAMLGGVTARQGLYRSNGIGANMQVQSTGVRFSGIETIYLILGLIGPGAIDVKAAILVFDDSRHQDERLLDVPGCRIRHIDKLLAAEVLRRSRFCRVDCGRGIQYVHYLLELLLMIQNNLETPGTIGDLLVDDLGEEALLFDFDLVSARAKTGKLDMPC